MNITLILTVAFMVFMAVRGYKKGMVKMITSIACVVLSLVAARLLAPAVSAALSKNLNFVQWIRNTVIPNVKGVTVPMVISAISYVVLFVAALAVMKLLSKLLKAIASLPVLHFLDHIAGGAFGIGEAVVYVWVFMIVVSVFQQFDICRTIMAQIRASQFLSVLYQNDPLITIVQNITL